jgi:hypothetical protein
MAKMIRKLVFFLFVIYAFPSKADDFKFGPTSLESMHPSALVISEFVAPDWLSHSFRVPYFVENEGDGLKPTPRFEGEHPMGRSFIFAGGYVRSPDREDWRAIALSPLNGSHVINLVSMADPSKGSAIVINSIKMENDPDREWFVFRWRSNGLIPDNRAYFGYKEDVKSTLHFPEERRKYLEEKYIK